MSLAIIGGTGALELLEVTDEWAVDSPYGQPSAPPALVLLGSSQAWFLARHGNPHRIAPHRVNYRANIDVLRRVGATRVVAINAVGGIDPTLQPGALVLPDQLIDYTWGRAHTFSDDADNPVDHVEFAEPFSGPIRELLLQAATDVSVAIHDGGCCAVTQGPRLETAAEIRKLSVDGCTLVGMTSMPEAALAREAGLDYASLCVVANPAAGLSDTPISVQQIHDVLALAMGQVRAVLESFSVLAANQ
jgi:5'-methylthioinosine phosphorylase